MLHAAGTKINFEEKKNETDPIRFGFRLCVNFSDTQRLRPASCGGNND
jgi:hypothetical protein